MKFTFLFRIFGQNSHLISKSTEGWGSTGLGKIKKKHFFGCFPYDDDDDGGGDCCCSSGGVKTLFY